MGALRVAWNPAVDARKAGHRAAICLTAHGGVLGDWLGRCGGYRLRRAVASLPCVMCGIAGYSQAAHGSEGKGMGIKASDLTLFPACAPRPGIAGCHAELDQGAKFSKAVRRELEPVWAADTRRKVQAMGLWPKNLPHWPGESPTPTP